MLRDVCLSAATLCGVIRGEEWLDNSYNLIIDIIVNILHLLRDATYSFAGWSWSTPTLGVKYTM